MDEKKKLIVVGVLATVILCVGAFQFLGGKPAGPPPAAPKATEAKMAGDKVATTAPAANAPPVIKNPQVANDLPARDPFFVPEDARPKMGYRPPSPSKIASRGSSAGHFHPLGDKGYVPLPIGGDQLKMTALPNSSAAKAAEDKPFDYKIVGTIGGVRPEVLVEDSAGNQKLVPVGSAIDGDSRVRGVEDGAVTIEHRGKKLRLTVGGNNPSGK